MNNMFASAFRLDGLTGEDTAEIIRFKDIVKSYLKMEAIESDEIFPFKLN